MTLRCFTLISILTVTFSSISQSEISVDKKVGAVEYGYADSSQLREYDQLINSYLQSGNSDSAILNTRRQYDLALELGETDWVALSLYNAGRAYEQKSELDSAFFLFQQSLSRYKLTNNKAKIKLLLDRIGVNRAYTGNYSGALEYFFLALDVATKMEDAKEIADSKNDIGACYLRLQQYGLARDYFQEGLDGARAAKDKIGEIKALNNLGAAYGNLEDFDSSIFYMRMAGQGFAGLGDTNRYAISEMNIGIIFMQLEQYDSATFYFKNSLKLARSINNNRTVADVGVYYGRTLRLKGEYSGALVVLEPTIRFHQESGDIARLMDAANEAHLCYLEFNEYEKALSAYKIHVESRDTLLNQEKLTSALELEYNYQLDKQHALDSLRAVEGQKLADTKVLAQKSDLARIRMFYYSLIVGVVLLVIVVFQVLKSRRLLKKQKEVVEENEQLLKIQAVKLKEELEYKDRELTNLALNLAHRNSFLRELRNGMNKTARSCKDDKTALSIKEMIMQVHQYNSISEEEEEFEKRLSEHSAGFYTKLEKMVPKLSDKERRLCAMLRLGLSSKEIAAITNISPQSVDTNRYRLRMKLDLKDQDLKNFIRSI